jgi:hypothetical protein
VLTTSQTPSSSAANSGNSIADQSIDNVFASATQQTFNPSQFEFPAGGRSVDADEGWEEREEQHDDDEKEDDDFNDDDDEDRDEDDDDEEENIHPTLHMRLPASNVNGRIEPAARPLTKRTLATKPRAAPQEKERKNPP